MLSSFYTFMRHTIRSYTQYMTKQTVAVTAATATVAAGAVLGGALVLNVVTAKADTEAWISSDVLDEDVFFADFTFVTDDDVPEDTVEGFHLQMPSSLEGYIKSEEYVSNSTESSGTGKQMIDDQLKLTTQPDFEGSLDFELPDQEELEESTEDATEFIKDRPPASPFS